MEHIPTVVMWGVGAVVAYVLFLHFLDGNPSMGKQPAPRQADIARLQIINQTANAQARMAVAKARRTRA